LSFACLLNKDNPLRILMNETCQITIVTQTKKRIPVTIRKEDTVQTLKLWIAKSEGISPEGQTLIYDGVELNDNSKNLIQDCEIHEGSTIGLNVSTRGGVQFDMPDVTKEKMRGLGSNPYKFYRVGEGLNYGGTCENKDCKAYNEPIICHRGLGMGIQPNKDQHILEKIRCPGCDKIFTVGKFFFFRCEVKITYKRSEDEKVQYKEKSVANEAWELGSDDTTQKAAYVFLEFDVNELKQKRQ